MSSAAVELATRCKISDPKPSHCSACFRGADENVTFVDFDAVLNRGGFADPNSLAMMDSIDDLHLCEACVREAAQLLNLKPDLHQRQVREIRRLELDNEHWRDYAQRLEQTLKTRPEAVD